MGTRRDSASDKLKRFGYDPLTLLVKHAQGTEPATPEQVDIAKELLPYAYPKLKAIDMVSTQEVSVTIKIGGSDGA